jgi:hypothetical protein
VLRLHFWPGRVAVLITALIALPAAGCGASVSVHGGVISGDGPYRAAWKHWWDGIQRDEKPYRATATSPGVCNVGGNKQACAATDARVAGSLRGLRTALRSVHVPGPYRRATNLTLLAISQDLRALNLRIRSLSVGPGRSRNATHGSDTRTSSYKLPGAPSQEAGPHFRTGPSQARPRKSDVAHTRPSGEHSGTLAQARVACGATVNARSPRCGHQDRGSSRCGFPTADPLGR